MNKKNVIFYAVGFEWIVFLIYCSLAPAGFKEIYSMQQQEKALRKEIQNLKKKKQQLLLDKKDWNEYPFYQEKVAREELHFQKDNEEIIIFDE
jgi:cell division protein FtsB